MLLCVQVSFNFLCKLVCFQNCHCCTKNLQYCSDEQSAVLDSGERETAHRWTFSFPNARDDITGFYWCCCVDLDKDQKNCSKENAFVFVGGCLWIINLWRKIIKILLSLPVFPQKISFVGAHKIEEETPVFYAIEGQLVALSCQAQGFDREPPGTGFKEDTDKVTNEHFAAFPVSRADGLLDMVLTVK